MPPEVPGKPTTPGRRTITGSAVSSITSASLASTMVGGRRSAAMALAMSQKPAVERLVGRHWGRPSRHAAPPTREDPPATTERPMEDATESSDRLRPRLQGITCRLLGSHAEAEEVVQDTWLRFHKMDQAAIAKPEAWLVTGAAARIKQATIHGERALRLHHLAIWRESPLFAPREPASLAWTEVLTKLPDHGAPDEGFARVRAQFSAQEIANLTFIVMPINAWNRANLAFKTVPGTFDAAFGLGQAHLQ